MNSAKAQRTANARKIEVQILKLVNGRDAVPDSSYIVVRKILDAGPHGEPRFNWSLVGTQGSRRDDARRESRPDPVFRRRDRRDV